MIEWIARQSAGSIWGVDGGDADLGIWVCHGVTEENAHKIAAMPEMYAALEGLMNPKGFLPDEEEYLAAENALAKARGSSNRHSHL